MRRLYWYFGALGALAVALLAIAGAASSAPVPNSQFVRFTLVNNGAAPTFFLDPAGFLPNAGCPFAPAERSGSQLTADVRGWETPVLVPELGTRNVSLRADVHGTVTDQAGSVYRLNGSFAESGTTQWPDYVVPFDGFGRLTVAGPAGVVSGDAEFRDVTEYPLEWDFTFTDITVCHIH